MGGHRTDGDVWRSPKFAAHEPKLSPPPLAAPWVPGKVGPSVLPHDGQPELLATREGPILHVASGIHWTNDAGQTWHKLQVPGAAYYPRSIQAADGRIFVFGHVGGDNAYGKVDQSIVMDSFRLKVK